MSPANFKVVCLLNGLQNPSLGLNHNVKWKKPLQNMDLNFNLSILLISQGFELSAL